MATKTKKSNKPLAHAAGNPGLLPLEKRRAVVTRLHKQGTDRGEILAACGYANGNGWGWLKRTMLAAGLRRK